MLGEIMKILHKNQERIMYRLIINSLYQEKRRNTGRWNVTVICPIH